jgi:hypothetical protein
MFSSCHWLHDVVLAAGELVVDCYTAIVGAVCASLVLVLVALSCWAPALPCLNACCLALCVLWHYCECMIPPSSMHSTQGHATTDACIRKISLLDMHLR